LQQSRSVVNITRSANNPLIDPENGTYVPATPVILLLVMKYRDSGEYLGIPGWHLIVSQTTNDGASLAGGCLWEESDANGLQGKRQLWAVNHNSLSGLQHEAGSPRKNHGSRSSAVTGLCEAALLLLPLILPPRPRRRCSHHPPVIGRLQSGHQFRGRTACPGPARSFALSYSARPQPAPAERPAISTPHCSRRRPRDGPVIYI
jgi:hypothetical protein